MLYILSSYEHQGFFGQLVNKMLSLKIRIRKRALQSKYPRTAVNFGNIFCDDRYLTVLINRKRQYYIIKLRQLKKETILYK